jgi:carbon-monoxide dehydrogenase large subunit
VLVNRRVADVEHALAVKVRTRPAASRGGGEGGALGSPPCVVNAVADALDPLGARITGTPLGPAQVLAALVAAEALP